MESKLPRGIPSVTYLSISSASQGPANLPSDLVVDGNVVGVNEPGVPTARFEVAQVLDRGLTDEELCEQTVGTKAGAGLGASLNPVAAFVQDAATAIIFFVGSKQSKKWKILKKTFLPFIANEVFSFLIDKEQQNILKTGSSEYYQRQLSLSAFEIQDEVVFDLQKPELKGLTIAMTPEEGYQVQGLHENFAVNDEVSLRRALFEACENRVSGYAQPVGSSIDTSTSVWELKLTQREVAVGSESAPIICKSRLIIIDVPSVDSLIEANIASTTGYYSLRQLQTTTLHRSLACFVEVNRRLSNPKLVLTAPFSKSLLTCYLSELMGGNSIVVGIGMVCPGEPLISKLTLEVMQLLTRSQHYPISGKETTLLLQGLLSKYRSLILQMQDEMVRGPKPLTDADVGENKDLKIIELQKEIGNLILEKNNLIADNNGLFNMMDLLKNKYNTILADKNKQNEELINSEEEKLALARALMELKMEHSQILETNEENNYKNSRAQLENQNKQRKLDETIRTLSASRDEMGKKIEELQSLLKQEQLDSSGLRASVAELRTSLKEEKDRIIEVGAELISRTQQRDHYQAKMVDLQSKLDAFNTKSQKADFQNEKLEEANNLLKSELGERDEQIKQLQLQLDKQEISIERLNLELEQQKKTAEREGMDFLKREQEMQNEHLKELQKMEEHFSLTKNDNTGKRALSEAELTVKKKDNIIKDLENEISRLRESSDIVKRREQKLIEENDFLRQSVRKALAKTLISPDDQDASSILNNAAESLVNPAGAVGGPNPPSSQRASKFLSPTSRKASDSGFSQSTLGKSGAVDIKINEEDVYKELVSTYVDREGRMLDSIDHLTGDNIELRKHLRLLINNYITVVRFLSDGLLGNSTVAPDSANPAFDAAYIEKWSKFFEVQEKKLSDELLIGKKAIEATNDLVEKSESLQQDISTSQIRSIQSDIVAENEKYVVIIKSYKNSLKQSEMRLAEHKNEIIDLKLQLKRLMDNPKLLLPNDQTGAENSSLMSNVKSDLFVTKKESEQQIKLLQDQLAGRLKDLLRDSRESMTSVQASMLSADEGALLKRPASRGIIAGINAGIPALSGGSGASTGLNIDDMGKINKDVMEYVRKLEKNANEAVLLQLRVCEESLIDLKSKNLFLTEQLSNYQIHMKKTVMQYKKQLLLLQEKLIKTAEQQQQQQQQSYRGGGGSGDLVLTDIHDDATKLPSIAK